MRFVYVVLLWALWHSTFGCFRRDCLYKKPQEKTEEEDIDEDPFYCQQCFSILECQNPIYVPCTPKYATQMLQQFIGQMPHFEVKTTRSEKRHCMAFSNYTKDLDRKYARVTEMRGCFYDENPFKNVPPNDELVDMYDLYCTLCTQDYCNAHGAYRMYLKMVTKSRSLNLLNTGKRRYFERPRKDGKPRQEEIITKTHLINVPALEDLRDVEDCLPWFRQLGEDNTTKPPPPPVFRSLPLEFP